MCLKIVPDHALIMDSGIATPLQSARLAYEVPPVIMILAAWSLELSQDLLHSVHSSLHACLMEVTL